MIKVQVTVSVCCSRDFDSAKTALQGLEVNLVPFAGSTLSQNSGLKGKSLLTTQFYTQDHLNYVQVKSRTGAVLVFLRIENFADEISPPKNS